MPLVTTPGPRLSSGRPVARAQEFWEFARKKDLAEGRTQTEIPYAIEGDRVGGLTIKLIFNKDSKWTKALKYMVRTPPHYPTRAGRLMRSQDRSRDVRICRHLQRTAPCPACVAA